MDTTDTLSQARYILATGRMIHDRVMRITTNACMSLGKTDRFGELSAPQMNMILMIRFRGEVSVTELATLLGVSPPSASTMVDRLVERGLLTRTPSEADRRKVVIRVSDRAVKTLAGVEETVLKSFVELVEALGPETTRQWCEVLEKIKQVLEGNGPSSTIKG